MASTPTDPPPAAGDTPAGHQPGTSTDTLADAAACRQPPHTTAGTSTTAGRSTTTGTTASAAPKSPAPSTQARKLAGLLDEIYDRILAPDVLFEIWIPTQWALVRETVGCCKQRWDKTLPVTAQITGPLVDGEMAVNLPLAKNYGKLVYPTASVEKCFNHICQLVVLQVLTATLGRQLVTVEVTVNS